MKDSDNKYIQTLVDASKKGSKNSFMQLCELNMETIYGLCLRVFANQQLAAKITKHIFLLSWKNIKQIRDNTSFNLWLHGFAVNIILEYLRQSISKKMNTEKIKPFEIKKLQLGELDKKILELANIERIIFVLHDLLKYSYKELADFITELSAEEIKQINIQARNKLIRGNIK